MTGWSCTDRLAVAWMAKHFGMRFSPMLDTGQVNWACQYPQRGVWSDEWEPLPPSWERFHVHPDSLFLLEPKVGDILRLYFHSPEMDEAAGAVMTGFYCGGREAITWFRNPADGCIEKETHKIDDHQWRIIQRDGKAFHPPRREETLSATTPCPGEPALLVDDDLLAWLITEKDRHGQLFMHHRGDQWAEAFHSTQVQMIDRILAIVAPGKEEA